MSNDEAIFDGMYEKLQKASKEIIPYYDIDKIKPYSVYIWTKGDNGQNVFDIQADKIMMYDESHEIIKEAKPIIENIQVILKQMKKLLDLDNQK